MKITGRYIGIDYGDKRIGVAVSDMMGLIAQSVKNIDNADIGKVCSKICELINQYSAVEVIIGFPKNMNGTIGDRAHKTLVFVNRLKEVITVPVVLWDERLTTRQAKRVLLLADVSRKKRKKVIDGLSAQLILQSYLDSLS